MKKLTTLIIMLLLGTFVLQAQPVASFTGPTEYCGNEQVLFESTSTGDIATYFWEVAGNGVSFGATYHPFLESYDPTQNQVYSICLTVTDNAGLEDVVCQDVLIYPYVPVTIINPTLCEGESITEAGNVYDENNFFGEEVYTSFNGCDSIVKIHLTFESGYQMANIEIDPVPYQQTSGGAISFDVICGTAPYDYVWSSGVPAGTVNVATNLAVGSYSVTVTDADNNEVSNFFIVTEGEELSFDVELAHLRKCEATEFNGPGIIQFNWSGGTPPYRIRRNGSQIYYVESGEGFSRDYSVWWDGDYEFSIEDDNGDVVVFPEMITMTYVHSSIEVNASPTDLTVCLGSVVELEAVAPDAVSFEWINNWSTVSCIDCPVTELTVAETYEFLEIRVEDEYGCISGDTIVVFGEDCDLVWPGDTNTDTIVNNFDLLNIGLAYDATGPVRNNATLDWVGQEADPWSLSNPDGSNYMHSDTDGNGVVNADDTLAISLNWGETHNFAGGPPGNLIPVYPPATGTVITMPFYVEPDTFVEGESLSVPVILGEMGAEAENVYGIAFTLEFDPAIIVPGSAYLSFDDSWIGSINDDMIEVQKTFHIDGKIDVCLTRTDHTSVTGAGQMGKLFITIEDDILFQSGGSGNLVTVDDGQTAFNITNVLILNSDGEQLEVNPSETTSVVLDTSTATKNINETKRIQVYPNPANDNLSITAPNLMIENVQLFSLEGVLLKSVQPAAEKYLMNTKALHDGVYIIRVHTPEGVMNRRVTILH